MISKILVPTDGSERAKETCRYAITLSKQTNATIRLLSVVNDDEVTNTARLIEAVGKTKSVVEEHYRKVAEEYVEELKGMCEKSNVSVETAISSGYPSQEIAKDAKESGADLIIMGAHGRRALLTTVLGSVTNNVISMKIDIPVLVVRHGSAINLISKILVPTDGSEIAEKAARYAVDLAKQVGASVIVLSVVDKPTAVTQAFPIFEAAPETIRSIEIGLRKAAENYVENIKSLCDKNGVHGWTVIREGHIVDEIAKEIEKDRPNLIIMGSRGRSALKAAVLGSVTTGVIHKQSEVPVLVVSAQ